MGIHFSVIRCNLSLSIKVSVFTSDRLNLLLLMFALVPMHSAHLYFECVRIQSFCKVSIAKHVVVI